MRIRCSVFTMLSRLRVGVCNVDVTCWMLCFDVVSCWRGVMVVTSWRCLVSALLVGGHSLALLYAGVACRQLFS